MGEIDIPIQIGPTHLQCGFSSDGHKSHLQLPFGETLDSRARSGPFDASPEIEIRGWWTLGDSVGRRGYVGKSPQDPPSFVRPCHPNFQVGNWRVMSQSEVYTADSI